MIRRIATVAFAGALLGAGSGTPKYVVSPAASPATRAAIAAGKSPEHGLPVILDVDWTTTRVKPGSSVDGVVTTSPNVIYVEGRYKYWNFVFTQIAPGQFHVAYTVPWLPPFLLGNWPIDVIARSLDGVEVRRSFLFTYAYY